MAIFITILAIRWGKYLATLPWWALFLKSSGLQLKRGWILWQPLFTVTVNSDITVQLDKPQINDDHPQFSTIGINISYFSFFSIWFYKTCLFILHLKLDFPRCHFRRQVIFNLIFAKCCTSCEFEIKKKKLILFKNMVDVILFHFCDSYSCFHHAVYQGVVFDTQFLEITKTNYLFLLVLFFTPK